MSTLEQRIRLEVARVITNSSNFPEPMRVHMWGRDLSEPIDKITAALAPAIKEAQAVAYDDCDGRWEAAHKMSHHEPWEYLPETNPYRSNDE